MSFLGGAFSRVSVGYLYWAVYLKFEIRFLNARHVFAKCARRRMSDGEFLRFIHASPLPWSMNTDGILRSSVLDVSAIGYSRVFHMDRISAYICRCAGRHYVFSDARVSLGI